MLTGCAGFIGSHLLQHLLNFGQWVTGLDNFSTGSRRNLLDVKHQVNKASWARFNLIEGDILDMNTCLQACDDAQLILHQAALGSVPRSIEQPLGTHQANTTGSLNLLQAASKTQIQRFVYASSSSVYGGGTGFSQTREEGDTTSPLSPYAVSKLMVEHYARIYADIYGLDTVGLRYFNVFGPRQRTSGPHCSVIPSWTRALLAGEPITVHGNGEHSRDFTYVSNIVQANMRAASIPYDQLKQPVYNIGCGANTTLGQLLEKILELLPTTPRSQVIYTHERPGDMRQTRAHLQRSRTELGYVVDKPLSQGLPATIEWYRHDYLKRKSCDDQAPSASRPAERYTRGQSTTSPRNQAAPSTVPH